MKLPLKFFTFLALAWACQSIAVPAQVIIIRHAETTTSSNELSLKGKERAAALVPYFLETADFIKNGAPVAIYAAIPPKPSSSSQRAIDTVKGLADNLKLTLRDKFESNDYKKMVEEIKTNSAYVGKLVLICWEQDVIPEIARAFGAFQIPGTWHGNSYDRTWVITFQNSGRSTFQNLPQRLLFGDSSS